MTTAYSESSTERIPGRSWTVRLIGYTDRSATITCSTAGCRMPPRSKDLVALRTFAARHAVAHSQAAAIRANASCHCYAQRCAAHPHGKVRCAGSTVMIGRHDPMVGRVWTVEEVCETCALLIPHATVIARAVRPRPAGTQPDVQPAVKAPAPAGPVVPGGFSSAGAGAKDGPAAPRRSRSTPQRPGRRSFGQGR
ncbi:hypothetical protein [Streptomyces sp. NPDC056707]|uniref:hypothetical protein n=1 Tax=Streptomyces sp. NPDC056707 TaxID=3345919 RepID=UPI0036BDF5EE